MKLSNIAYLFMIQAFMACTEELPLGEETASPEVRTIEVNMPELTKTALGDNAADGVQVVWSKGDEIAVVENKGTAAQKHSVYRLVGEGGTTSGVFEYISGEALGELITDVVYPASSVENGCAVAKSQTYTEDSFDPQAMVMSWTRTTENEAIVLSHQASALRLTLTGTAEQKISSISVSFGRSNYVLSCAEAVALTSEGKTFHIAVPGSETSLDYTFTIYPESGVPMIRTATHTLAAGKIGVLPTSAFAPVSVGDFLKDGLVVQVTDEYAKVVSLDEAQLKWAESSVASTRVGTEADPADGIANTIMFKERADFNLFPAALWCINYGDDWYMPSKAELLNMVDALGIKGGSKTEMSEAQTALNNAIVAKGGMGFNYGSYYWSSGEDAENASNARVVRLYDKGQGGYGKSGSSRPVRAMKRVYYASTTPEETPELPPVVENSEYDVFLLIGQSNMAGRGTMTAEDQNVFDENVFILNAAGEVEPAKNPLNAYSSIRKALSEQGINPGFSFSKKIAAETGRKVLLVVNARGGSGIGSWKPTSSPAAALDGAELQYYDEAVRRTKQALKYGRLMGVLWHQGESNSSAPSKYLTHLEEIVDGLREDFNDPDLPFIAGEIAQWHANASKFNPIIQQISSTIPNTDYVSTEGCGQLKDDSDPHFSRDGQILLGERYAEKILKYCYNK